MAGRDLSLVVEHAVLEAEMRPGASDAAVVRNDGLDLLDAHYFMVAIIEAGLSLYTKLRSISTGQS